MRIMAALLLAILSSAAGAEGARVSVAATILSHCQVSSGPAGPGTAVLLRCNGTEPLRRRIIVGAPFARVTATRDDKVLRVEF